MTIQTITIDTDHWQVVPREMTHKMRDVIRMGNGGWRELLTAAPEPPAQQPTEPYVVRAHSYGGLTGINDYLMSNGSVVAMRPDEAAKCRPPAPAQQPMTNKQAHAIAEKIWDEYGIPRWQTLRIIRDTELHHGIGKDRT